MVRSVLAGALRFRMLLVGAAVGLAGIAAGLSLTGVEEWRDLRSSFGPGRRRRGGRRAGVGR